MSEEQGSAVPTDNALWFRETLVASALRDALYYAVENGGDPAKAFAWDVNCRFWQFLRSPTPPKDNRDAE